MRSILLIISFLVSTFSFSQKVDYVKLVSGMSTDEFRKVVSKVIPASDDFNGTGSEKMVYENIDGFWKYEFSKNILISALFDSFEHIDFSDLNENKSIATKHKFVAFYKNSSAILKILIDKYGEPTSLQFDDTNGIVFNRSTSDISFFIAKWETEELSIRFNAIYDGRSPNDPYRNQINAATESYGFVAQIQFVGEEETKKMHFRLGETAQEMEKINSKIFKNGTGFFGHYSIDHNWKTLLGKWDFCFKNGKLSNAGFNYNYFEHSNEDPLTKKKYDLLISNFRAIKTDLETSFGKPKSGKDEIPDYKKIEEHKISGVDFLQYEWKTKNQLIRLSLRYHYGGKGEFHSSMYFDVKITDLDGKYSYCDR